MINLYDLSEIYSVIILVRFRTRYEKNVDIIKAIRDGILSDEPMNYSRIRNEIAKVQNLDKEVYSFVYQQNTYSIIDNVDPIIETLFIRICDSLISLLQAEQYMQAEDLADAVHNLPYILLRNDLKITNKFWKTHLRYYREKWDRDFLQQEQKALRHLQIKHRRR